MIFNTEYINAIIEIHSIQAAYYVKPAAMNLSDITFK